MKLALKIAGSLLFSGSLIYGATCLPRAERESYVARGQFVCGETRDTVELCTLLIPAEQLYWVASVERGQLPRNETLVCARNIVHEKVPDGRTFSPLKLRCRDGAGTVVEFAVRDYELGPLEPLLKRIGER